jgi:3-isopropylmalate dehydrogenase
MQTLTFTTLPGDGIGPEVMEAAMAVLSHVANRDGLSLRTEECLIGGAAIDATGTAFPEATREACARADAILFGSVGGAKWDTLPPKQRPERASLLPIRQAFELFANIRPGLCLPELTEASPLKNGLIAEGIDIVIVRELTGGAYFGQPKHTRTLDDGQREAIDTTVYRTGEIERIARVAGHTAMARKKRLCSLDKANVLETSILWRETVTAVIEGEFPEVELSHMYADNAAMQLVREPNQFDVMLTENLFGDVLSDEMAVVCGSLGMMASASLGAKHNPHGLPFGLYEPAGGTAPDIAGEGIANPCAQILSGALMLRHSFGLEQTASAIETAVQRAVADGIRTGDIAFGAKPVTTAEMTAAIIDRL